MANDNDSDDGDDTTKQGDKPSDVKVVAQKEEKFPRKRVTNTVSPNICSN